MMTGAGLRRLIIVLAVLGLSVGIGLGMSVASAADSHKDHLRATSQFQVVITGDSILRLTQSGLTGLGSGVFFDVEDGRQVAVRGATGRLSSSEAVRNYLPMVAPGGVFVFQDNGAQASVSEWRSLLRSVVDTLPDDRCLIGVLPVMVAPLNAAAAQDTAVKAQVMVQEFVRQPCHDYVRWNQQVAKDKSLVYDGQHPGPAGVAWLSGELSRRVGGALA